MSQTVQQYNEVIDTCKALFDKKTKDYGTAWRILRLPSVTDQIFIKAQRIRTIQEKGTQMIAEDIASEFVGIVNYSVIGLMQMQLGENDPIDLPFEQVECLYTQEVSKTLDLLSKKNHDYGEAWRHMRIESMTDLILMKIHRIKQIENNGGSTLVSEGIDANYRDILNYAVFCLILLHSG